MHQFLDIRTLALFSGTISFSTFVCMEYIHSRGKIYPGFSLWSLAFMYYFAGLVLISLRGIVPDFFTIILANTFLVLCYVLIARGLIDFAAGRQRLWMDMLPVVVTVTTFLYFTYVTPDVRARVVAISLMTALVCLRCSGIVFRDLPQAAGRKNGLLIVAFVFSTAWLLLRMFVTVLFEDNIKDFMLAGTVHGLTFVALTTALLFAAIGLIMINSQRMGESLTLAQEKIELLNNYLPACARCKKIRNEDGSWSPVETYIQKHSSAQFSHTVCPDCAKKLYPDLDLDFSNTRD